MHRQTVLRNQMSHNQYKIWCECTNIQVKVLNIISPHETELYHYYHNEKVMLF